MRRRWPRRRRARGDPSRGAAGDRGMVTAELATVLPVVVIILVAAIWGVSVAMVKARCLDAAREAARAAARGEQVETVREVAEQVAPESAEVEIRHRDGMVLVEVASRVGPPLPMAEALPGVTVRGRAVALEESR